MPTFLRSYLYISLLVLPLLAQADTEIAGLKIADRYTLADESLTLNGAGIRSKFFVKVYAGALYMKNTTGDARQAIASAGPKSMQMFILYKEIDAEKITRGWDEGVENNLSSAKQEKVADQLKSFNALFPDLRAGDRVYIDFIPGQGTSLTINDKQLGQIEGDELFTALLTVWLGQDPADGNLKDGLLGN